MSDSESSDSDIEYTKAVGAKDEEYDDWQEEEVDPVQCLFCAEVLPSMPEFNAHTKAKHAFDLSETRAKLKLDFYAAIRFVNFVRRKTAAGQTAADTMKAVGEGGVALFEGEENLKPFFDNDTLLFNLDDEEVEVPETEVDAAAREIERLQFQVQGLTELLTGDDGPTSLSAAQVNEHSKAREEGYIDSYSSTHIHLEMLGDVVRTESYRDSMYLNKDAFKDKVVLDIGCGTGILCMFAARSGAKAVIGIDMSEMLDHARGVVKENGLDGVITLIKGRVEDVTLPVDKVDIIVSEWMGYFLHYEAMIETVLFARDKWLNPGGLVMPDLSKILVAGMTLPDHYTLRWREKFWNKDIYGFKMATMQPAVRHDWEKDIEEPLIEVFQPDLTLTTTADIARFDATTMNADALDFEQAFDLTAEKNGWFDAVLTHFDIYFEKGLANPVFFSTGARATPTHWKQVAFVLRDAFEVKTGDVIKTRLVCKRNAKHHRHLDVSLEVTAPNGTKQSQEYYLH